MANGTRKVTQTQVEDEALSIDAELVTTAPNDWEFETVVGRAPTLVEFDTIGDCFVGQFSGVEHIAPEGKLDENGKPLEFDRFVFIARDGNPYAVNPSYKLEQAHKDGLLKEGNWARITYVADIPTGRKLNPMKDFTVEIRK